jgi:hypothetical protein
MVVGFKLTSRLAVNVSENAWPMLAGFAAVLTITSPGSIGMLNSRWDTSSRAHQEGPPSAAVQS